MLPPILGVPTRMVFVKTCSRCGQQKPEDQFHFRSKTKRVRFSRCKDCDREHARERSLARRIPCSCGELMDHRSRRCRDCEHRARDPYVGQAHRRCAACGKVKSLDFFYPQGSGHHPYCKPCRKEIDAARDRVRSPRSRQLGWYRKLKESTPCVDCGENHPFYVMQFDHVRGEKQFNVSAAVGNVKKERVLEEIEKCDLVCANCHAVRTHAG